MPAPLFSSFLKKSRSFLKSAMKPIVTQSTAVKLMAGIGLFGLSFTASNIFKKSAAKQKAVVASKTAAVKSMLQADYREDFAKHEDKLKPVLDTAQTVAGLKAAVKQVMGTPLSEENKFELDSATHASEVYAKVREKFLPDTLSQIQIQSPVKADLAHAEINSDYGPRIIFGEEDFHNGEDYKGKPGDPVFALASGAVTHAFVDSGNRGAIYIDAGNGYQLRLYHVVLGKVAVGQKVEAGDKISKIATTDLYGYSHVTGPHVHAELWKDGKDLNISHVRENDGLYAETRNTALGRRLNPSVLQAIQNDATGSTVMTWAEAQRSVKNKQAFVAGVDIIQEEMSEAMHENFAIEQQQEELQVEQAMAAVELNMDKDLGEFDESTPLPAEAVVETSENLIGKTVMWDSPATGAPMVILGSAESMLDAGFQMEEKPLESDYVAVANVQKKSGGIKFGNLAKKQQNSRTRKLFDMRAAAPVAHVASVTTAYKENKTVLAKEANTFTGWLLKLKNAG